MDNTTHPLLVPRYRVIADYPGCPFEIGTILLVDADGELYSDMHGFAQSAVKIMEKEAKRFKHLVEPLPWYAERRPEEMPQYLRFQKDEEVYKIEKWDMKHLVGFIDINRRQGCSLLTWKPEHGYVPATETEYNAYLSSKKVREREKKEG